MHNKVDTNWWLEGNKKIQENVEVNPIQKWDLLGRSTGCSWLTECLAKPAAHYLASVRRIWVLRVMLRWSCALHILFVSLNVLIWIPIFYWVVHCLIPPNQARLTQITFGPGSKSSAGEPGDRGSHNRVRWAHELWGFRVSSSMPRFSLIQGSRCEVPNSCSWYFTIGQMCIPLVYASLHACLCDVRLVLKQLISVNSTIVLPP